MHFIYIMREEDKQKMISLGYHLLKEDTRNNVYVFQCKDLKFDCGDELLDAGIKHVMSDMLTF